MQLVIPIILASCKLFPLKDLMSRWGFGV